MPATVRGTGTTWYIPFCAITDIHFSPNNPNPTEDLLRSVAQINATDSIDFVLVTGDITEEGDRATMLKVKETLDLLKAKYYVVLGNHETKWSDSGCTAFGEIFGGERFEFEHKGILFLGFNSGPLDCRMAYGHVVPAGHPLDGRKKWISLEKTNRLYSSHTIRYWTEMWITGMK